MENGPLPDHSRQSFSLKFWIEDALEETRRPKWRGYIKHHLRNKEQEPEYFESMTDLIVTLMPYMEEISVKPNIFLQLLRRMNQWKKNISYLKNTILPG
jgi:hypothetical protein